MYKNFLVLLFVLLFALFALLAVILVTPVKAAKPTISLLCTSQCIRMQIQIPGDTGEQAHLFVECQKFCSGEIQWQDIKPYVFEYEYPWIFPRPGNRDY